MGTSYVVMLIAFYVDNGKQLPLWKDLPQFMYWLLPLAIGVPLIVRSLLWHPLARAPRLIQAPSAERAGPGVPRPGTPDAR
jgi:hypothetical protein